MITTEFQNDNGRTYRILAITNFNRVDEEYYKNSWQKCAYALLQDVKNEEYIVVTYLGETSWGSGYYADGFKDAFTHYTKQSKEYLLG